MPSPGGESATSRILAVLPGLGLSASVAALAWFLTTPSGAPLARFGWIPIAIALGIVIGNLVPRARLHPGLRFSEKRLLELAVVLYGVNLQFAVLSQLGVVIVGVVVIMVLAIVALAGACAPFFPGRRNRDNALGAALLVGAGMGVCGSAAVAALAPIVKHEKQDVGLIVSAINLLGVGGLFLIPVIATQFSLSATESAILAGGSLPAVGHVVAAGLTLGEEVGQSALLVKMVRILMIGPVALLTAWYVRRPDSLQSKQKLGLPLFLVGFLAMALLAPFLPPEMVLLIKQAAKALLALSMAAIGLNVALRRLVSDGPGFLFVAAGLFLFQIALLLLVFQLAIWQ